jgi:hypothetical protein
MVSNIDLVLNGSPLFLDLLKLFQFLINFDLLLCLLLFLEQDLLVGPASLGRELH